MRCQGSQEVEDIALVICIRKYSHHADDRNPAQLHFSPTLQ